MALRRRQARVQRSAMSKRRSARTPLSGPDAGAIRLTHLAPREFAKAIFRRTFCAVDFLAQANSIMLTPNHFSVESVFRNQ